MTRRYKLAALAAALVVADCVEGPTGPGSQAPARLRVELVLPAGTPDAWLPSGDTLRLLVRRAGRVEPIVDTAGVTDSLAATVTVPLDQAVERFVATAELVYNGQVMFLAFEAVQLRAALDTTIVLTAAYVGPGGAAALLTVAAADSTLEGGDTTTVLPTALDSIGQSLGRVPVRFRSLRPDLFTVDSTGLVTALDGVPDTARVDVVMPTGLTASLPLWLVNALGPFTQTIAFISTRDGNRELYVMNDDGSGARRLTTTPDPESFPAWAPDRSAIVFERVVGDATEIFTLTVGDGTELQLTSDGTNNSSPRYSPDGSRIGFTSRRGGRAEVWVMNGDGGNQRRLLDPFADGSELTFGDWSPDGLGVVFLRQPDATVGWPEAWVSDTAGGALRMVLGPGEGSLPDLLGARWGPLGGLVAYTHVQTDTVVLVLGLDQSGGSAVGDAGAAFVGHAAFAGADDRFVFEGDADGAHAIYRQDAAGTVGRLSPAGVAEYEPDVARPTPAIYVDRIVISPDSVGLTSDESGQTFTASGVDAAGQTVPVAVQWLAPSDGISQLVAGPPVETVALGVGKTYAIASYRGWRSDSAPITITPATGPTAQRLAFRIGTQIYTMRGDGTDTIRLTTPAIGGYEPAFSPDGARIAWTNLTGGNGDLWVMNADGTSPTAVTSGAADDAQPSWSPDGRQVVFTANRVSAAATQRQLWVVGLDGSGLRQITFPPAANLQDVDPAWSPDGSVILFTRFVLGSGTSSLRSVDVADGAERALAMPAGSYRYPAWVPDGSAFVYTRVNVGTFLEYLGIGRIPYPPASEAVLSNGSSPRGFAAGGHLVPSVAEDGLIAFSSGLGVTVMRGDGTALSGLVPGGVPGNWQRTTPPRYVAAVSIGGDVATLIPAGGTRQLTASATDQGGSPIVPVGGFRWTALDPDVATVDSTGFVTAAAVGSARIVVSSGVATPDTATVTVGGGVVPGTRTWAGGAAAGPSDWFVAANWSPEGVPQATDTVVVPGATDQPVLTAAAVVAALRITGGSLTLNGNTVTVTGDFSTEAGLGTITMQQPGDILTVQGRALFAGGSTAGLLTDGLLTVAGDFEQRNVASNTETFRAFGNHRTILNGAGAQLLVLEGNPSFGHLEIANAGGVQAPLATTIGVAGTFTIATPVTFDGGGNSLDVEGAVATVAGSTLSTLELRVFGPLDVAGTFDVGSTEFAGVDQEIPALAYQNVRVSDQARLGASVTIAGSLRVSGGSSGSSLTINGHTLTVASLRTGGGGADPASLTMRNPSDVVVVTDFALFDGDAATDRMTEGVLYVGGHLLDGGSGATGTALRASGNHRTVLNGSGLQQIRIENGRPVFHHLEIANTGPGVGIPLVGEGVEFTVAGKLVISTPVPFSGLGAYGDVGDSLVTVAGSAVTLGGLVLRGGIAVNGALAPATIEFAGTNQDIPPSGVYGGIVVSGMARLTGATDAGVNLLVRGVQANLTMNGHRFTAVSVTLGGVLDGTGTLTMTNPADTLAVAGDLAFFGAPTAGLLTAGTILVGGGVFQGENPAAFQPSGSHRTVLNGTTQQIVSFANPGITGATSRFHDLELAQTAGGVRFQTAAAVGGALRADPALPQLVTGPGSLVSVESVDVAGLTLDGIALALGAGALARFDSVTFRNQDPAAVQLSITHPGSVTPFTFTGVRFLTSPTTGYYVSATDVAPADGNVLTINLASSQPLDGAARTITAGGAIVNWPGARTRTWVGGDVARPTDWFVASNWSPTGVPNATDTVVVPAGATTSPVLTGNVEAGVLRVRGGSITLAGHRLGVTGAFSTGADGTFGGATGRLIMQDPLDTLIIGGDATWWGDTEQGYLTAGVIQFRGGVRQGFGYSSTATFTAAGTHRTILDGTAPQTVTFDSPALDTTAAHFQDLEVANPAGVTFAGDNAVRGTVTVTSGGATGIGTVVIGGSLTDPVGDRWRVTNTTFAGAPSLPARLTSNVRTQGGTTLDKDVAITGNLRVAQASLNLGGRSLSVSGNLVTGEDGGFGAGVIIMQSPADSLTVEGSATFWGSSEAGLLTAGVIRLRGNFTQRFYYSATASFTAGGTHRIVLDGSTLQTVAFDSPGLDAASAHFQDLDLANGGGMTVVGGLVTVGKLRVTTPVPLTGAAVTVADSLVTAPGSGLAPATLRLGGGMAVAGGFTPPATEFFGAGQTIQGGLSYGDVTVTGSAAFGGATTIAGDVLITNGTGDLRINGQTVTVGGDFQTGNFNIGTGGVLRMTDPADSLDIQGNAVFDGSSETGLLTAGVLVLRGNFSQRLFYSSTSSFTASGTHRTVFAGGAAQSASFDTPGGDPGSSHFQDLELANTTGGLTLSTAAIVNGDLRTGGAGAQSVTSTGATLSVAGLDVDGLTLDNVPLSVGAGTLTRFDNVTFQNFAPAATQLAIAHAGAATAFTFSGLRFLTTPSTGYYISATDVAPADGNVLTINLVSSQPLNGAARTLTAGGAIVTWPGSQTRTWVGGDAADATSWFVAGNWSPAGVPNPSDSVVIPTTTDQPALTADATVARLRITGGNLTLGGHALTVMGDFSTEGGSGGGSFTMQDAADVLTVLGNAMFAGAPLVGRLTAGTLAVAGNFTQTYIGSNWEAFQASGTHRTVLNGPGPQAVAFTNPGTQGQSSFFQHLEIANPAGITFTANAAANGKLRISGASPVGGAGTLTVADSLVTVAGSTANPAGLRLGGGMAVAGTFSPTLTEFFGAAQTIQAGLAYQNILVTGQTLLAGPTSFTGDLTIARIANQPSGDLDLNGQSLTVTGNLRTGQGSDASGMVTMQDAADVLTVQGNATFAGAPLIGRLTAGTLMVAGDFTQTYVGSNWEGFQASGTHRTVLNGAAPQAVAFTNPGTQGQASFFHHLDLANVGGITLNTPAVVNGDLRTGSAGAQAVTGTGLPLSVAGLDVDGLTLDNVPLSVGAGTLTRFDNVTFQNFAPAATQLAIAHAGATTAFTFSGLRFLTTPSTGYYVSATDAAPGDGNVLTIELAESQPADGSSRTVTSGGAAVIWLGTRPPPFAAMSSGQGYSCGLAVAGTPYCWGRNFDGSLGDGTTMERHVPTPVSGGLTLGGITAGWSHGCGLTTAGAAYCWGSNGYGQLGDGTTANSLVPVAVQGAVSFTALAAGDQHTCGLTTAGAVYCWGGNGYGQLGDGTTIDRTTPTAVSGGLTFASVRPGGLHTCGVTIAGQAYCWGSNTFGQLGDATATQREAPVAVSGGLTFSTVSATGSSHSCGVTTGGAAYCWGWNGSGELGDGSTTSSPVPALVAGGLTFASVSAGGAHTCGLTTSGSAYCWGLNDFGQLGDGTTTQRTSPVPVSGGLTFGSIDAGFAHVAAIASGGAGYSWGSNTSGELGDGTTTSRSVPTLVTAPLP